jgi:uncharacterized protein (DUF1015 family)
MPQGEHLMADIRPFHAVRYAAGTPLDRVVTQPYDKIPPELRQTYLARDPHNLVNLILPDEGGGMDKYRHSAALFQQWYAAGVFARDAAAGIYPYRQQFDIFGQSHVRGGFIARIHVEPYEKKIVFPHERTLAKPKADRLSLLRAGRVHYGLIFLLYEDDGRVQAILDAAMQSAPCAALTDDFAVRNELWQISNAARVQAVQAAMADKQVFIADGHHRYETSLAYTAEQPDDLCAQYTMAMFVNIRGPLVILPTHRSVYGIENYAPAQVRQALQRDFTLQPCATLDALLAATRAPQGVACLGVYDGKEFYAATLTDLAPMRAAAPEHSDDWRALDVAILHTLVIERALGISAARVEQEAGVHYHRDPQEALQRVQSGAAQCAFFLRPTAAAQVCAVARNGEVMPQKSTDFYPKLLSGLTMYALDLQGA